jgi:hypothetical protein
MKRFLTTAAIITALAVPAFAEGEDASTKAGEAKGNVKASTDQKQDAATGAMGQGAIVAPRATTGASSTDQQLNKTEGSSSANPGKKTGVTGGGDDSGGGGGSAGSAGSGSK